MKILLDTNIIIHREDNREVDETLQKLMQKIQQEGYEICIHPSSMKDIENDPDQERRKIILSKLKSYPQLKSPPSYKEDESFKDRLWDFQNLSSNGLIDLDLFYALYRNAVYCLITEDRQIHRWAQLFSIEHCYKVQEALNFFVELKKDNNRLSGPPIYRRPLHNLRLEDPFFDSLKRDYGPDSFEKWFKTKAQEGSEAYVSFDRSDRLNAFLLLKEEKREWIDSKPEPCYKEKILKICTLKVSALGNKLGERFLSIALQYAIDRDIDEIYLTHFISGPDDHLVELINKFGFLKSDKYKEHNHRDDPEAIFFKRLCPTKPIKIRSVEELGTAYFPSFYDGSSTRKFIVPIRPPWYDRLFPDQRKQTYLFEFYGKFSVEGNTIKKAYLSHSNTKRIRVGDILLFYKTGSKPKDKPKMILGTVDKIEYGVNSVEHAYRLVAKRTVYTQNEVEELIKDKPLTVILFKYHFPLPKPLSLSTLRREQLINGTPQSITQIKEESYLKLKNISRIRTKFAISNHD